METSDYWEGFHEALVLMGIEVDKIMAVGYNDRRSNDQMLDIKCKINDLKEMAPEYDRPAVV